MKPKIYNTIANLSLIVAVVSTFLWDKAPLIALLMAVAAALTGTATYFYNRAQSVEWAPVVAEQAEPETKHDPSKKFVRYTPQTEEESDDVLAKAVLGFTAVLTGGLRVIEAPHHRRRKIYNQAAASTLDFGKYEQLIRLMQPHADVKSHNLYWREDSGFWQDEEETERQYRELPFFGWQRKDSAQ